MSSKQELDSRAAAGETVVPGELVARAWRHSRISLRGGAREARLAPSSWVTTATSRWARRAGLPRMKCPAAKPRRLPVRDRRDQVYKSVVTF
uniref:Uncharacterized protein n=1 Tax=Physcomitrium patens TaxID=3218 RepID=A0A2K1IYU3_PHYPA|nr:hypothetical protein PHYPA_024265 [Physcomitrium patens]